VKVLAVLVALTVLTTAPSAGAPRLRVAYVTDVVASPSPHTLRGVALIGFQRAVRELRVEPRVVQFDPRRGMGPTISSLGRRGYDLVLVGEVQSGLDVAAVVSVGKKYPHTKFVLVDPPFVERWPSNVQGSIWRVEQPAYLAGYLAGLEEKRRPGRDVVGSVGGFEIPTVDAFIAGFQAGAKKADPGVTTLRAYTNDFFDTAKCAAAARGEIARGAGVLFNVAGACGVGTLQAAREKGVWAVGVDVDQSYLGPYILTSVLKRFDVEVYDTVKAFVGGRLRTGGNAVWDVRNGAVGLGAISPKVPKAFVRQVDRVRAQIAAGLITVPSALR
jgi:basic membrane protein A